MKEGRKLKKSNLHEGFASAQVVEKVQRKKKEKVSNVEHPQATVQAITPNRKKVELKKKKKKVAEEIGISNEKIKGNKGKLNKAKNKRKADEISSGPVDDHLIKQADDDTNVANDATETRNRKSKKKRKMKLTSTKEIEKKNKVEEEEEDVYEISSGDEDCSRGMKILCETAEWVTDYYENRPGLDELQKRIDDFMTAHEERLEQLMTIQTWLMMQLKRETVRKSKKKRKMKLTSTKEIEKKNKVEEEEEDVYEISSGDEDCSRGMKKWVTDYYENRPGLDELQKRIDDFMTAHEERLEQEKQEREAKAAEGGWTVVVHHKGRKKTTDAESGTAVGSVSQAALEDKVAKKKKTEIVGHGFYRFQRRDAQRSELLALQTKFEEDKKRIQQIRAARKFKPY
ncbi:hypothetical protein DY000_02033503 [Brassica cretica]|uniref:Ribosomal RNA-processing protein 7 C-terminal domain-containing protein n=1 Tax=Brassica cretica TaxID=69181 RepID=A0ABQ7DQN9_BRACR|nr:hypothetical protein DY000_02033503 [Brassica cretica]